MLSSDATRLLADIAARLERQREATDGLCMRGETRHVKHGLLGFANPPEPIDEPVNSPDAPETPHDFIPLLVGPDYSRTEEAATHPDELRVRVERRTPAGPEDESVSGALFVFSRSSVRLLQATIDPPPPPRDFLGRLLRVTGVEMLFDEVNGVPLAIQMRLRVQSVGIGRLRLDHEAITDVRYEPCMSGTPSDDPGASSSTVHD